jgi:hypothetical protein
LKSEIPVPGTPLIDKCKNDGDIAKLKEKITKLQPDDLRDDFKELIELIEQPYPEVKVDVISK